MTFVLVSTIFFLRRLQLKLRNRKAKSMHRLASSRDKRDDDNKEIALFLMNSFHAALSVLLFDGPIPCRARCRRCFSRGNHPPAKAETQPQATVTTGSARNIFE